EPYFNYYLNDYKVIKYFIMRTNYPFLFLFKLVFAFFSCANKDAINEETIMELLCFYEELNISIGNDTNQVFDLYLQ
ncbi:MAG: hypothetical protein ACPG6B_05285, partial [Oceanihabitans sp.]